MERKNSAMSQNGNRYNFGDMVFVRGMHRRCPWWPGQIYDEELAPTFVKERKKDGHLLVSFFGNESYGWFKQMDMIPFHLRIIPKVNSSELKIFSSAVEESEREISRRAALGLTCKCKNPNNFWPSFVDGYFGVDVYGHTGPRGYAIYNSKQIGEARKQFSPLTVLRFLGLRAVMHGPVNNGQRIDWMKNIATILAYRKVVFKGDNSASCHGTEGQPIDVEIIEDLDDQGEVPSQAKCAERPVVKKAKMSRSRILELKAELVRSSQSHHSTTSASS